MRSRSGLVHVLALCTLLPATHGLAQELTLPSFAADLARGFDGNIWVTQPYTNRILRITPNGDIRAFDIPTANSNPQGITRGPDNALWFCEQAANKIGRIDSNGNITEKPIGSPVSPQRIALGGDGRLWFTQVGSSFNNALGRMTTGGTYSSVPLSDSSLYPYDISDGPDGNLWMTTGAQTVVARITTGGTLSKFPLASGGHASRITTGPDGAMWFTVNAGGAIILGRDSEPQGTLSTYRIYAGRIATNASNGTSPQEFLVYNNTTFRYATGITAGADGNVWYGLNNPTEAGRITTTGASFTSTTLPAESKNGDVLEMDLGGDGAVWYTAAGVENGPPYILGRIPVPCPGDIPNFRSTGYSPGPPATLILSFDAPPGANAFTVYELLRAEATDYCNLPTSVANFSVVASTRSNSVAASMPNADRVYAFFVRVKGCPNSTTGGALVGDTFTQPPGTPQLAVVASGTSQVTVTYTQPDARTFSDDLEHAVGSGTFSLLRSFEVSDTDTYCPPGMPHSVTIGNLAAGTHSFRLSADNLGSGRTVVSPIVTVVLPPGITVTPSPLNLRVQAQGTLTVTLNEPLGTDVTLALSSTSPNVAAPTASTLVIAAGKTTGTITVQGLSTGNASIVVAMPAGYGGATASAAVVVSPNVTLNLTPSPLELRPGGQGTMTAVLSAAQEGATVISVASSNPQAATFGGASSTQVTIPAGQVSQTFTVNGVAVGTSTVTASLPPGAPFGGGTASATVNVRAFPTLSLSPSPANVQEGASLRMTAFLSAAEGADVAVALSTSASSIASLPQASVTIPAGSVAASFSVQAGTPGTAVISGALPAPVGGAQASANVTVSANPKITLSPSPLSVRATRTGTLTATLSAAPVADAVITLATSDPAIASVPASVTVPAGQTTASITVTGLVPGTVTVSAAVPAALGGATANAQVNVTEDCDRPNPPGAPRIVVAGNANAVVTGTDYLELRWSAASGTVTGYEVRLGAEDRKRVGAAQTSLSHAPVGDNGGQPLQLFVRSVACTNPEQTSDEAASDPLVLANSNPSADFDGPSTAAAGTPVTFTDRSRNATSWLWFTDESAFTSATTQAFTKTFTTPGVKRVYLIAGNGNGSSLASKLITITAAGRRPALAVSPEPLLRDDPERQRLANVEVAGGVLLQVGTPRPEGAVLYLRLLKDGELVAERRLVLAGGEDALYALSAFVPPGTYDIEVIGWKDFQAFVLRDGEGEREERDPHAD